MDKEGKEPAIRRGKDAFIKDLTREERKSSSGPAQEEAKAPPPDAAAAPGNRRETRQKMSKLRHLIVQRLVEARASTVTLTTFNEIDLSEVITLRHKYRDKFIHDYGVRLGYMSFFVKACVAALDEFPNMNSYIDGEEMVHREYFDIGVAVSTERGLVVPVLRECDKLTYAQIEEQLADFATRATTGGLSVDDLQGGGFTLTNDGAAGSFLSTPILYPSQSGIMGMHKIEKRPVVVNDQVVIRPMMYVAVSYDQRVVDGQTAEQFLVHVKEVLEDPARIMLHI